jgi:sugar lactone lactonase YvrE
MKSRENMRTLARLIVSILFGLGLWGQTQTAQGFRITALGSDGTVSWDGAFPGGICMIQAARTPVGPWRPVRNLFTTTAAGSLRMPAAGGQEFYRLVALDLPPTEEGFRNLCAAYGPLQTVAGKGEFSADGYNGWLPDFEGGAATSAELSRPHMAMADSQGNIFIADKDGHAIRKVLPSGQIVTVAGTNVAGDDGDSPGLGIQRRLASPNGLWVRADGTVYILDLDNSKVRRLDTSGVMTTLFKVGSGIDGGRGLWVKDDESLVYFSSGNSVRKWTPDNGVKTVANGFADLGNLVVDPAGNLVVTDRGANRVYRVSKGGNKTPIAGNGDLTGGGDGFPALETGLAGVRGVWFLPHGAYLLATHEGSQVWYVDTAGTIRLLVDGSRGAHDGDNDYFRTPGLKVSEVRAVTVDYQGRIIITENDAGFIRTIDFLPAN